MAGLSREGKAAIMASMGETRGNCRAGSRNDLQPHSYLRTSVVRFSCGSVVGVIRPRKSE